MAAPWDSKCTDESAQETATGSEGSKRGVRMKAGLSVTENKPGEQLGKTGTNGSRYDQNADFAVCPLDLPSEHERDEVAGDA